MGPLQEGKGLRPAEQRFAQAAEYLDQDEKQCELTQVIGPVYDSHDLGEEDFVILGPSLFPPCAPISHAQGSSGVVDNMPFAWRGHTKEPRHSGQAEP